MQIAEQNVLEEVFVLNKYRLKFSKTGKMIYIGHLDLLKFFIRLIKRAGLPIAYSNGFNPHQQITFAIPLSLGTFSIGEYLDIQLTEEMSCDEIKYRCNKALPLGIEILDVREIPEGEKNCASAIAAADYTIKLENRIDNLQNVIDEILSEKSIVLEREVKKKIKTVDIRPMIFSLSSDDNMTINTKIATGSQGNLKVDLLIEYIYKKLNMEYSPYKQKITRLEMYKEKDGEFIAL